MALTPSLESERASTLDLARDEGGGGSPGEPEGSADTPFADKFNREFARQLHVFGVSLSEAATRGPTLSAGDHGGASGEALGQRDLDGLFTPTQQRLLDGFCDTHQIPDRLFNGDEVGGASAPQRIVMSGHILSVGTYRPGSFAQAVHARMCGHWINLVNHYAGVGEGDRGGAREGFDHTGRLSIAVGESTDEETGDSRLGIARHGEFDGVSRRHRRTEEEALEAGEDASERAGFRSSNLGRDRLDTLLPGDWLYVFNDNGPAEGRGTGGGNHSVVFSRYASGWMTGDEGQEYRRIACMSQISPSAGGHEENRLIGPLYSHVDGHHITPVTSVSRPTEGARPVRDATELAAALGTGREAGFNERFIQRQIGRRGGHFDFDTLASDLRTQNIALIQELAAGLGGERMTPAQRTAFTDLNDEARAPQSAQSIGRLVRLHQRLTSYVRGARAIDAGREASREGVETRRTAQADQAAPQVAAQWRQIHRFEARLHGWVEEEMESARALISEHGLLELNPLADRVGEKLADWYQKRNDLPGVAPEQLEQRRREADQAEADLNTSREALWERVEQARVARQVPNPYRQRHRRATNNIARLPAQRLDPERRIREAGERTGYHTAHITRREDQAAFQGTGEHIDGQLEHLDPTPDWSRYIVRDGAAAE